MGSVRCTKGSILLCVISSCSTSSTFVDSCSGSAGRTEHLDRVCRADQLIFFPVHKQRRAIYLVQLRLVVKAALHHHVTQTPDQPVVVFQQLLSSAEVTFTLKKGLTSISAAGLRLVANSIAGVLPIDRPNT